MKRSTQEAEALVVSGPLLLFILNMRLFRRRHQGFPLRSSSGLSGVTSVGTFGFDLSGELFEKVKY